MLLFMMLRLRILKILKEDIPRLFSVEVRLSPVKTGLDLSSAAAATVTSEGFGFNIDNDEISLTYNDYDSVTGDVLSEEELCGLVTEKQFKASTYQMDDIRNIINVEDYDSVTGDALDINAMTTDGTDIVFGNESDNVIDGKGGDDILLGGGGDDVLIGNLGDDIIIGGDGEDIIRGDVPVDDLASGYFAAGYFDEDTLIDLGGRDVMIGGDGIDDIATGEGNDLVASGRFETAEGSDSADIEFINNMIDLDDSDKDLFEDDVSGYNFSTLFYFLMYLILVNKHYPSH